MTASRLSLQDKRRLAVVAFAVLALGLALALRGEASLWLPTGVAGGLSLALALAVEGPTLLRALRGRGREVALGVAGGIAMAVATWVVYPPVAGAIPAVRMEVVQLYGELRAPPGPLYALPILVLVVFAEELVWRELWVRATADRLRPWLVILAGTVLYSLPQVGMRSWLLGLVAFGCGLIWTAQRVLTGSLIVPTLTHLLWDLAVFTAFPLE